jgi:hypothetical protein
MFPQQAENAARALLFFDVVSHFVADLGHQVIELVALGASLLQLRERFLE